MSSKISKWPSVAGSQKRRERVLEHKAREVSGREVVGSCKDSKIIKITLVLPSVRWKYTEGKRDMN